MKNVKKEANLKIKKEIINKPAIVDKRNDKKVICPICGNTENSYKVSAIYSSGISESSYSGSAISFNVPFSSKESSSMGYTPFSVSGITASELSNKLAPPPIPKKKSSGCLFAFLLFIAIGSTPSLTAGSVVILSDIQEPMDAIGGIIILSILIGIWSLAVFIIKRKNRLSKENYEHEVELYNKVKPIWDRLYYCFRDDIVFNPASGKYVSADDINNLIYN